MGRLYHLFGAREESRSSPGPDGKVIGAADLFLARQNKRRVLGPQVVTPEGNNVSGMIPLHETIWVLLERFKRRSKRELTAIRLPLYREDDDNHFRPLHNKGWQFFLNNEEDPDDIALLEPWNPDDPEGSFSYFLRTVGGHNPSQIKAILAKLVFVREPLK